MVNIPPMKMVIGGGGLFLFFGGEPQDGRRDPSQPSRSPRSRATTFCAAVEGEVVQAIEIYFLDLWGYPHFRKHLYIYPLVI